MRRESLGEALSGDESFALVVQGGGMRGTYSIAALTALDEAGYRGRFADVFGTSAGALNSAYFLAGQARQGISIYVEHLSNTRFINPRRFWRVIDIDYLVDEVLTRRCPLDVNAVLAAQARLYIGLASAKSGEMVWADNSGRWPLLEVLRATAALPVVFGHEIPINGDCFVDGGLHASVPLFRALEAGYQNVVVVMTRPSDFQAPGMNPVIGMATRLAARLKGHSPIIVRQLGRKDDELDRVLERLRASERDDERRIWVIAPSQPIAGRLTNDRNILRHTADVGHDDAVAVLTGQRRIAGA